MAEPETEGPSETEGEGPSKTARPPKTCYQRAVDLLSRRAHFTAELRFKLRQRGFDDPEIDGVMLRLGEEGYVDDVETAHLWLEQQLRRKPQGPSKLLAGLLRRGVDGEIARDAVRELVDRREPELIEEALERRLARSGSHSEAALARHLDRLGFRAGAVLRAVRKRRTKA